MTQQANRTMPWETADTCKHAGTRLTSYGLRECVTCGAEVNAMPEIRELKGGQGRDPRNRAVALWQCMGSVADERFDERVRELQAELPFCEIRFKRWLYPGGSVLMLYAAPLRHLDQSV